MSRFLFLTFDGGGNQPPAIGIAQELRERGHEIVFAGYASQRARFMAHGFVFALLERSQAALEQASSADGFRMLLDGMLICAPQLEEVPALFARERADALVVDCMLFAALAACERAQLPAAVLVHSPPGALLSPDRVLGQRVPRPLNALRAIAGLGPLAQLWESWGGIAVLCTSIAELDPLAAEIPPACEYVGPVFERMPPSGWRAPWPRDDVRPLILASFSTTASQDPQGSRVRRTLAGLAGRPYRVLLTDGATDVSGIELPESAVVVRYVPHGEVLPAAAATVTHAGHGMIAAALAHGVPLVCLPHPVIADQMPLAEHLERLGAGRALDGESATGTDIAAAVDAVLSNSTYRASAGKLARVIAATRGAATAASRLERLAARPHRLK
jgi:UDP:flavonoid glycosyltransferase YjiC (YdhE family)